MSHLAAAALAAVLAANAASPGHAPSAAPAANPDSVYTLPVEEVVEVRAHDDPALRRAPGFARSYDVSHSYGRLRTTADLLAGGVGVHVRQFGGLGSFSAVSIRGSASSQVAFYLDGVPLNQAQYGVVNAADLPIEALGRIEVFRGAAPLAFEAPGGGVVQLLSRADGRTWARASAGAGSFGTRKSDGAFGLTRGRTSALVVGQYLESDGDFPYRDDNATDAETGDDEDARRANNAFVSRAWTARVTTASGPLAASLVHDRLDKAQGTPGTGANTARAAGLRSARALSGLVLRGTPAAPGAGRVEPALLVYAVRHRDRFVDPERELTGSRVDSDDRTTRDGARLSLRAPVLPDDHALELVAEARRERFTPRQNVPAPSAGPTRVRRFVALGAEDRWTPGGGRFGLTGQLRQEATFDAFPAGAPYPGALPVAASARTTRFTRGTLAARLDLLGEAGGGGGGTLAIRASASRLGRTPTLEELFGHRGGVHGNPQARPERLVTHDAGVIADLAFGPGAAGVHPRWLEAQVAAYRTDATDLLVFLQNSAQTSVAQNVAAARLEGLEFAARAAWPGGLSADLSLTRQWTRDEGEAVFWRGRALPGRPRDEASLRLSYARGAWRPFGEVHHVGTHFLDRANLKPQPARTLVDLGLALAPGAGALEATLECRNLTDRRVFDFGGYPLPGRSWFAGLRYRFDGKDGRP
jgi:iron complex outermembrane receptor protein